jgi:predicted nucleic acid-binding protein
MIVVAADTGPLKYLILIEAADLLEPLYERVVIPQTVASEMKTLGSPASVRDGFQVRPLGLKWFWTARSTEFSPIRISSNVRLSQRRYF